MNHKAPNYEFNLQEVPPNINEYKFSEFLVH